MTKIDDNVDISRAKLENTLIIFLKLSFPMENLSLKKIFYEFFTAGLFYVSVRCNVMMKFFSSQII